MKVRVVWVAQLVWCRGAVSPGSASVALSVRAVADCYGGARADGDEIGFEDRVSVLVKFVNGLLNRC